MIISVQNLWRKCHNIKFLHVIKFWSPLYIQAKFILRSISQCSETLWQFKLATWLRVYNYVKNKHLRAETVAYLEVVSKT
jgi:hypothetical protein